MIEGIQFVGMTFAIPMVLFMVAAFISSTTDSGRVVFRAAERALSEDAATWQVTEGDSFTPTSAKGHGFIVREHHPFKVFVNVADAGTVRAGFGWAVRLSLAASGMLAEKEKIERLNGLSDAMESLFERNCK